MKWHDVADEDIYIAYAYLFIVVVVLNGCIFFSLFSCNCRYFLCLNMLGCLAWVGNEKRDGCSLF